MSLHSKYLPCWWCCQCTSWLLGCSPASGTNGWGLSRCSTWAPSTSATASVPCSWSAGLPLLPSEDCQTRISWLNTSIPWIGCPEGKLSLFWFPTVGPCPCTCGVASCFWTCIGWVGSTCPSDRPFWTPFNWSQFRIPPKWVSFRCAIERTL